MSERKKTVCEKWEKKEGKEKSRNDREIIDKVSIYNAQLWKTTVWSEI